MRKIFILTISCILAPNTIATAHNGNLCSHGVTAHSRAMVFPVQPRRQFDVLKYQLTLDWRKIFETKSQQYSGVNNISLVITAKTSEIILDAALMKIDSVRVNGIIVTPAPQPTTDEKLIIPLSTSLQAPGEPITISIGYHKDTLLNSGIYFYPKGTLDAYTHTNTTEDLAYTMSEPLDAHYWMPCMDLPYDKSESEISIIVPNGIEASSNGTLQSKVPFDSKSTIWHWKSDEPIVTYLMVANASNFIHWGETHKRSNTPGDTVHLDYYAWPSDYYQDSITDGSTYNAKHFLGNTSQIMSYLEARYGGFPFVKYGQVPVQPFYYGGMEHQTLTSINRSWLRGYDQGIAHEMAHQWFGDKTTCDTWKDIWLNEGFATFSEAIWADGWGGNDWYEKVIQSKANDYFSGGIHDIPIYDPPANNIFNGALTYAKGACVLHMLRRWVNNDTMFFGAMKDYSNAFAYITVITVQFRDFMSARLKMDLTEYFDQWIFGKLHPLYDISWAQNATNRLFLRINQTHDISIRDHFTMPVRFFAYHGTVVDTLTFMNDQRSQGFQKMLSFTLDSLTFDEDAVILSHNKMTNAPILAVHSTGDEVSAGFEIYPEMYELLCKIATASAISGKIEIYNSVGVRVESAEVGLGQVSKRLDIRNLLTGVYFVRYSNSRTNIVRSLNIVR